MRNDNQCDQIWRNGKIEGIIQTSGHIELTLQTRDNLMKFVTDKKYFNWAGALV